MFTSPLTRPVNALTKGQRAKEGRLESAPETTLKYQALDSNLAKAKYCMCICQRICYSLATTMSALSLGVLRMQGHLQQYTRIGKQAERFELQAWYYELRAFEHNAGLIISLQ